MSALSRFSYLIVSLILVGAAVVANVLLQWGVAGQIGTLILLAALAIYWVGARRGALTPVDPEKKLRRSRGGGRPLVVYFYSDFSLNCLLRRPALSRMESRYNGRCEFMYISVFHQDARRIMESLKAELGDYLFFDVQGKLKGTAQTLSAEQMNRFLESSL